MTGPPAGIVSTADWRLVCANESLARQHDQSSTELHNMPAYDEEAEIERPERAHL